jgi:signal transduction histidine kinase
MRRRTKPAKAKVGPRVGDLEKRLAETREQQAATSEILRVISQSPTDVQPVFDAILRNAVRLSGAIYGTVYRLDGGTVHSDAQHNFTPQQAEDWRRIYPRSLTSMPGPAGRVLRTGRVYRASDLAAELDPHFPPEVLASLRARDVRSVLIVPMFRQREVIGAIGLTHREASAFTDVHVELIATFADQAVIAIENVRLFKELEGRNRDLTEALERQTATSAILRVISRSATDIQPVLETIVEHAGRLCGALDALVFLVEGDQLVRKAHRGPVPITEGSFSFPIDRDSASGRAVVECRTVHVEDFLASQEFPRGRAIAERSGFRTAVTVPLVKEGAAIGTLVARRAEAQPFTPEQIALLETFADQAVIAIENVRLFTELQEKNRALTEAHAQVSEALERQTATSEILRVISSSPTNLQPIFDAILARATSLCEAHLGVLQLCEGDSYRAVAHRGASAEFERWLFEGPRPLDAVTGVGRAIREVQPIHIIDIADAPAYRERHPARVATVELGGARTFLAVPMVKEGNAIGGIVIYRSEVRPFTDRQIELVQTFADQAVIAIENARLFNELQARTAQLTHSVEQLTALGDVGRALSSTLDLDAVLQTIVTRASQLAGADACSVFEYDEASEAFHLRATHSLDQEVVAVARRTPIRKGEGVQGRMAITRQPVQIPDIAAEDAYHGPLRDILLRTGTRALLAVPLLREDQLIGGLTVNKKTPGEFSLETIDLLKTFATQSALAIQNARLFREIANKSRQLEIASQHKSEFLANMSHELRTPLNAIIGFSEALTERMFGDLNDKQDEYLEDIHASGQHLLSLINDILDLSKIEAGRMDLDRTEFDVSQAIDNALMLVRDRAARRGIVLHQAVDQRLGQVTADERKIKQVLLNLLSNALKFTPEGGRVDVRASVVDGMAEVSVTDTGVGIAPEDQQAVFEEFRQVGTAAKKVEGTGLGLALSRKFIELHGGRIRVTSQVGAGSTFTFTLPLTI